ncbi:MAG: universal stress protein [Saprospiraceae bacterium]|nr:universal stress protein [Saprospiraceae bacterium]MCB9324880.1 universal stress protein [Lewinellaceae bacterium]
MISIEILGLRGYHETELLKANLIKALEHFEMDVQIAEVTDVDALVNTHVDGIPALVVNGEVLVQNEIPEVKDLELMLKNLFNKEKSSPMKKIITSTDFSTTSMEGFQFAMEMASLLEASVDLVHVYSGTFSPDQPIIMQTAPTQHEAIVRHLKNFEKKGVDAFKATSGKIPQVTTKAVLGFPEVELVKFSNQEDAYMVVMSTSGSHGISGKLFGTISTYVARKASCPVMLIPRETVFKPFRHILYASNFEGVDEKNIQRLTQFAQLFKANIHFVHVQTNKEATPTFKEVEDRILSVIFKEGDPSYSFEMTEVNSESIVEGLNRYAEEKKIDLVVMVSPHRHFLESLFHKSTTTAFAFNSTLPVMVLH